MDSDKLNQAVQDCVRHAIGKPDPCVALLESLDQLTADGWPLHQIERVRGAAMQILSGVYGVSEVDDDPEQQAH